MLQKWGKNLWMDFVREPKYLPSSKTLHVFTLIEYCMILIILFISQIGEIYFHVLCIWRNKKKNLMVYIRSVYSA